MKRLWILLMLLCIMPVMALAAEKLDLEVEPGLVRYVFTLKENSYAVIDYRTSTEKGQLVVHGDKGHFEGELALDYTPAGGNLTFKVLDTKLVEYNSKSVKLPAQPDYVPVKGRGYVQIRDFSAEGTLDGFRYRFRAEGAEMLNIRARTRSQTVQMPITPVDENGWFEGEIKMPLVYAYSTIYIDILSANGETTLLQKDAVKGYQAIPCVEKAEKGPLTGVIVCVDAGHQLKSEYVSEPLGPGLDGMGSAVGGMAQGLTTSRKEHIVCLEIAMVLRNELLRQGADVLMTRTEVDQFVSNIGRDEVANEGNAHIMLRLHCDYDDNNTGRYGISIHCPINSTYAKAVMPKEEYRRMAELMLTDMKTAVGVPLANYTGPVVQTDKFVGNNWAKMLCFLVEMGFMTNTSDDLLLSTPEYQQQLADGMAKGVYDIAIEQGWISVE